MRSALVLIPEVIYRRRMAKPSPFFLVLLGFGFFVATYNLVTLVIHSQNNDGEMELSRRSDSMIQRPNELKESEGQRRPFHVALTATDSPYSKWQCRIMYYWYKKMKDSEGSEMGGFTRVLHSGSPDDLMKEIPTFVVDPLPSGVDQHLALKPDGGGMAPRLVQVLNFILAMLREHLEAYLPHHQVSHRVPSHRATRASRVVSWRDASAECKILS
ncbi:hypothetical protein KFK09_002375 [Dendrobium nobile]|uniref:Hydroxyproline O-arabinosyltransferase-like domain-containing protein n=1 Tax=Dendrobium nobile TaxID=94219 RepID=A0A8T3C1G9_DENNO|nr:hypothetical protein KFK09_002375 [Dendrobium nobile]